MDKHSIDLSPGVLSSSSQVPVSPDAAGPIYSDQMVRASQESLRRLERHNCSLWISAILVMLVLAFGMYSFTLVPGNKNIPHEDLKRFTWGLFALLIVFAVFALHRQTLVNRLRRELAVQINLAAALQTRSELFQKLAILDPLTGLYNRRFAVQHLALEIARCDRHQHKLTALLFDLNGLKQINDRHSHLAGDLVLCTFADALRRAVRSSDVTIRMGADEFLVLLAECEEIGIPRVLARMANLRCSYAGQEIPIQYSAGWAEHTQGENSEQLLARAEQRLCEDKRTGTAIHRARAVQEQLQQAVKMEVMGRLTSTVAHDFNNLLTIIKGSTELVSYTLDRDHPAHAHLGQVQTACERAADLIRQLLAFSRKQVLEPRNLNLVATVSAMQMLLQRLLGSRIELVLQFAPELHEVRADPGQIEQLVINLIANAREAMSNGGRVAIELSNFCMTDDFIASHPGARHGDYVCLSVHDGSPGMDKEAQKHAFDPFFFTKDPTSGIGLGLSIVYGIVKQNGGYIWLDSQPGDGNCISIYLPRCSASKTELLEPASPEIPVPQSRKGQGVLVVESFDTLRHLMCDFVKMAGYHPLPAASGEQAIEMMHAEENDVELMICDVVLPGMSGLELSQCLAEHRNLKVLYVSGYVEDTLMYREYLKDTAHVLSAPFSADDLSQKLRALTALPSTSGPDVHQVQ